MALLLAACSSPGDAHYGSGSVAPDGAASSATALAPVRAAHSATGGPPVIAAAGDIACEPGRNPTPTTCQQVATSRLLDKVKLTAVLTLGDPQYVTGRLKAFQTVYGPTWGRYLGITHPAPGNHEYTSATGLQGYLDYYGAAAGTPTRPYYSLDIGSWHVIALDAECTQVGGCAAGSAEEKWLAADLAAHPARCTLAMWHEPRFSSGGHGNDLEVSAFWNDLYRAGADVVLNGHDHDYERFGPQTPNGAADPAYGIREFVVGTGGKSLRTIHRLRPNSEAHVSAFGVLFLTLKPDSYSWRFEAIPGGAPFSDFGSGNCH